jgi:hypothetical protein
MEDKFTFFVEAEIEKGPSDPNDPKRYKNMIVRGCASTNDTDIDEEILEPNGFELGVFKSKGLINYDHGSKKTPKMFIGEPIKAGVVDNKFVVEGKLWEKHPLARDLYDTVDIMKSSGSTRKLGWSIEGIPLRKDPHNPKRITKALITNIALTFGPKNPSTFAEFVKGVNAPTELDYDIPEGVDYLYKGVFGEFEYTLNKDFTITKSKSGVYENNEENRKLGRVGQKYGSEKKEEESRYSNSTYGGSDMRNWYQKPGANPKRDEEKKRNAKEEFKVKLKKRELNTKISGLEKEVNKILREMESDPEAIELAKQGKEAIEYTNRIMPIQKKIDKLYEQLKNLETVEKAFDEDLISIEVFEKAMCAGSETGQSLVGKDTTGAALKTESLDDDLKILTIPIASINWISDTWKSFTDDTKKALQKAFHNQIEKGGEGSRGGHIIGRTKSGKPIYETANHPGHKDFNTSEHYEAAKLHNQLKKDAPEHEMDKHNKESEKHTDLAEEKRENEKKKTEAILKLRKDEILKDRYGY